MPISQRCARSALKKSSGCGSPSRRDVRVAVVARALAAHAAERLTRRRAEAASVRVMAPLGEIIGSFRG